MPARTVFLVHGLSDPGLLLRVVELFAQRGLVPAKVAMHDRDGRTVMRVVLDGLDAHAADVIAEKMRSMVIVERVGVERSHLAELRAAA